MSFSLIIERINKIKTIIRCLSDLYMLQTLIPSSSLSSSTLALQHLLLAVDQTPRSNSKQQLNSELLSSVAAIILLFLEEEINSCRILAEFIKSHAKGLCTLNCSCCAVDSSLNS